MTLDIKIPQEVEYIISELEKNGHSAYAVGGCIRDSLMGREPEDWDICTSALPEQTLKCFGRHVMLETGFKHGTVTLMLDRKPFEITTYRVDGTYSDNRRPDKVNFVGNLKEDLSRRDFTINAMAYNPREGIADFFGGMEDLRAKSIRSVGSANQRFNEDALRIVRALRFASALGFSLDSSTAAAIRVNCHLLKNIAAERIANELDKLIAGESATDILHEYASVLAEFVPEIKPDIKAVRRRLNKYGEEKLRLLLEIKNSGGEVYALLDEILKQQHFSLKDLAVNGDDLIDMGIPQGVEIGTILNRLMTMVDEGLVENNKDELLKKAVHLGI